MSNNIVSVYGMGEIRKSTTKHIKVKITYKYNKMDKSTYKRITQIDLLNQ